MQRWMLFLLAALPLTTFTQGNRWITHLGASQTFTHYNSNDWSGTFYSTALLLPSIGLCLADPAKNHFRFSLQPRVTYTQGGTYGSSGLGCNYSYSHHWKMLEIALDPTVDFILFTGPRHGTFLNFGFGASFRTLQEGAYHFSSNLYCYSSGESSSATYDHNGGLYQHGKSVRSVLHAGLGHGYESRSGRRWQWEATAVIEGAVIAHANESPNLGAQLKLGYFVVKTP